MGAPQSSDLWSCGRCCCQECCISAAPRQPSRNCPLHARGGARGGIVVCTVNSALLLLDPLSSAGPGQSPVLRLCLPLLSSFSHDFPPFLCTGLSGCVTLLGPEAVSHVGVVGALLQGGPYRQAARESAGAELEFSTVAGYEYCDVGSRPAMVSHSPTVSSYEIVPCIARFVKRGGCILGLPWKVVESAIQPTNWK